MQRRTYFRWWPCCLGMVAYLSSSCHGKKPLTFIAVVGNSATREKGVLHMGLYDSPLPPPPPPSSFSPGGDKKEDETSKEEVQATKEDVNMGQKSTVDSDDEEESLSISDGPTRVFSFCLTDNDTLLQEVNGHLPPLPPEMLGYPFDDSWWKSSPYSPNDDKVLHLMEMTACHAMDVAIALRAWSGSIPKAFGALSKAQKWILEQSSNENVNSGIPREEMLGPDEEELGRALLQQERRLGKNSGIPPKPKAQQLFDSLFGDTDFATNEPDAPWLPGKPNPRPVDDEPWFTG